MFLVFWCSHLYILWFFWCFCGNLLALQLMETQFSHQDSSSCENWCSVFVLMKLMFPHSNIFSCTCWHVACSVRWRVCVCCVWDSAVTLVCRWKMHVFIWIVLLVQSRKSELISQPLSGEESRCREGTQRLNRPHLFFCGVSVCGI